MKTLIRLKQKPQLLIKKKKIKTKSTISFIEKQINSLKATITKIPYKKLPNKFQVLTLRQNHFANWFEMDVRYKVKMGLILLWQSSLC